MEASNQRAIQAEIESKLELDKGGRRRAARRTLIGRVALIVLAGAAIGGGYLWWTSGSKETVRYTTTEARRGALTVIVTATGSIEPTNKVEISSELSGMIRTVNVDYNDNVTSGQVLAELDTDKLVATAASSRAKLIAAQAKEAEAKATSLQKARDYERKSDLAERRVVSALDLDTAKADYDRALASEQSAAADIAVAEADLKLAETNLAKASIVSPISGVVLSRAVDPGQTVAASLQAPVLFTIAEDLRQMEAQVDVDEADVGKVAEGQKATFSVDAYPDREFPAEIKQVRYGSETLQGVVTYKAILVADNSDLRLRPGMTATADIVVEEVEDALLVPNAALRFSPPSTAAAQKTSLLQKLLPFRMPFRQPGVQEDLGKDARVYVLKDGAPERISVTIGSSDGRNTVVAGGELAAGQAVIVDATTTSK